MNQMMIDDRTNHTIYEIEVELKEMLNLDDVDINVTSSIMTLTNGSST